MENTNSVLTRQRGGFLTAYLVLGMIINPLLVFFYYFTLLSAVGSYSGLIIILMLMAFATTTCVAAMWYWQKWGAIGYLLLGFISVVLNLFIVGPSSYVLAAIGGLILAWLLFQNKWKYFE